MSNIIKFLKGFVSTKFHISIRKNELGHILGEAQCEFQEAL